jgi:cytidylate kinase
MRRITIAIDRYSANGKSTLAKDLANKLDYIFFDSGAMYRGVALYYLRNNLFNKKSPCDEEIIKALPKIHLTFEKIEDNNTLFLNRENVKNKYAQIK